MLSVGTAGHALASLQSCLVRHCHAHGLVLIMCISSTGSNVSCPENCQGSKVSDLATDMDFSFTPLSKA